jgi:cytochrome c peroxidase
MMFPIDSRAGVASSLALAIVALTAAPAPANDLTPIEQLGKSIFFDQDLSFNKNLACAGCHGPEVGFTGPESDTNEFGAVYEGSFLGRFGNRKPPSAAYATQSPILHYEIEKKEAVFVGGNFWDGRATGEKLGNPAADQAQGPFLNPVEQALPDSACVVYRVCMATSYPVGFEAVWGDSACAIVWPGDVEAQCTTEGGSVGLSNDDRGNSDMAYDQIALSIAAYEASPEVNSFTSKYDYSLRGMAKLSKEERKGLSLYKGKAKCTRCHVLHPSEPHQPLLTDFTYDNLGVPRNPDNPWYLSPLNPDGYDWVDKGLGGFLKSAGYDEDVWEANLGKQKVPTLRNVDKRPDPGFVKAFTHNGYFKELWQVVHFYNTRDVKPVCADRFAPVEDALAEDCWPEPEVAENVNEDELGDLGLSAEEEDAIVAFLKTLSDGYVP